MTIRLDHWDRIKFGDKVEVSFTEGIKREGEFIKPLVEDERLWGCKVKVNGEILIINIDQVRKVV